MARAPRTPRFHSRNVLAEVGDRTWLWSFLGSEVRPAGIVEQPGTEPLPAALVGKGWAQLLRPRLNILWLTGRRVFLQLVHLPTDDASEVPAMLELQVEKLSPLPLGQVVWTFEILPQRPPNGLSVLVVIAERTGVEAALGDLEKKGFCADCAESPLLPLVAGTDLSEDGAYLFVHGRGERRVCLVGWVNHGVLQALNIVNLSADDRWVKQMVAELGRLACSGELAGWASGLPAVHLVADAETVEEWSGRLKEVLEVPVIGHPRPADADLAAASARRASRTGATTNLLPPEYVVRYRQEYTDRLWMGGLMALMAAYLVGVLIYLGAVEVQRLRQNRIADDLAVVNSAYTNTLRLKAQAQVLQETVDLRFAALESWLATVEELPEELSLDNLTFSGGQTLVISGWAPADQEGRITEYWQALRRKMVGDGPLFSEVQLRPTARRTVRGVPQIQWSFVCRFPRPEI